MKNRFRDTQLFIYRLFDNFINGITKKGSVFD